MPTKSINYFLGLIPLALLFLFKQPCYAQNGKIKAKGFQDIVVTNMTGDLDFGTLFYNQGVVRIARTDPGAVVLQVEGKENQKIRASFTAPDNLILNATNTLPFTLEAAYNENGDNNPASAQTIVNPSTSDTIFRLPKNKGPEKRAEAYLYVYGSVTVGKVNAGTYTEIINVSVKYD